MTRLPAAQVGSHGKASHFMLTHKLIINTTGDVIMNAAPRPTPGEMMMSLCVSMLRMLTAAHIVLARRNGGPASSQQQGRRPTGEQFAFFGGKWCEKWSSFSLSVRVQSFSAVGTLCAEFQGLRMVLWSAERPLPQLI